MLTDSNELLGRTLGTCTLQRLLGRGGMGAVYLARQSRPRRTVAVKLLLPAVFLEQRPRAEFLLRFRREADAIAALDHMNIMPIYEYGEQEELAYLVMPYVPGGTLREVLEKRGILPLEEIVPIIEQAGSALDCAHAQGIVHRDLKPANILLHADGRILLADFGLAKVIKEVEQKERESNGHSMLTSAGTIIGTPEYLSPEQGTGNSIDHRADIYSLGIVLYQMLAGRIPFTGTSPVAVAVKHALEAPPPLTQFNPTVSPAVDAVVMKAIAKAPEQRFSSAGEFARALRDAASGIFPQDAVKSTPLTLGGNETQPETSDLHAALTEKEQRVVVEKESEPRDQVASLSTVLMPNDARATPPQEDAHEAATEISTDLAAQLEKEQVASLPTVVAHSDEVAERPPAEAQGAQNVVATPPVKKRQEKRSATPPPAKRATPPVTPAPPEPVRRDMAPTRREVESPQVLLRQEAVREVPPAQQGAAAPPGPGRREADPTYPPSRSHAGCQSVWMMLIGSLLTLAIVAGGFAAYLRWMPVNQSKTPSTATITATKPANKATPTPSVAVSQKPGTLPNAAISAGTRLYGTALPGKACDTQGGQWSTTSGATVKCNATNVLVTGDGSGTPVGTVLDKIPGTQLPNNYIVQVQVDVNANPTGSFGVFFLTQPGSAPLNSYAFLVNSSGSWNFDSLDDTAGGVTPLATQQPLEDRVAGTLTIDVVVQSGEFTFYVNGHHAGVGGSARYTSGNVGLAVSGGSQVSFKNLAVYALP